MPENQNNDKQIEDLAPWQLVYMLQVTIVFVLFRVFDWIFSKDTSIDLRGKDVKPNKAYLLTANHQSGLDPMVICTSLPLAASIKMLPFYFMTKDSFFERAWLRPFLKAFGCFPAKNMTPEVRGIEYAQQLLRQGQTVMIFPEGGRTMSRQLPARRGVSALAETDNTMIIPAYIQWHRRHRFSLAVGKPYYTHQPDANDILDNVYQQNQLLVSSQTQ